MIWSRMNQGMGWWVLTLLVIVSGIFLVTASLHDAAITDERAHIPAGYGYVRELDYRLNPEHPPLIKIIAAFPLLLWGAHFPSDRTEWQNDVNSQWAVGTQFIYYAGNDADTLIRLARAGPILVTLLLIILIYLWAQELMGPLWALLPATLTALSPIILAHGHFVTTDVGAAFGVVLFTWAVTRYVIRPSQKNMWIAGIALGIAELAKFSTVLLVPFALFLALVIGFLEIRRTPVSLLKKLTLFLTRAASWCGKMFLVFIIGYVVIVYPVYGVTTLRYPIAKQVHDTAWILGSFGNGPTLPGAHCLPARCIADLDIWMSKHTLTRPFAEYLLGVLMVLQRSSGGNTNYFLSTVSAAGSRLYFPVVYALKEPLPTLIIVGLALVLALWNICRVFRRRRGRVWHTFWDFVEVNVAEFGMLVFVLIYWIYSMKSPLNIGVRHLIPSLPLIYILASMGWKHWFETHSLASNVNRAEAMIQRIVHRFKMVPKYALLVTLLIWLFLETALAAPYFLSSFNELGGGVWYGYRYVTDSNYDWGQDLLDLQKFVDTHPEVNRIAVDYFGGGQPQYYLGDKELDWNSAKGNPATQGIHWLAVSINTLEGAMGNTAPGFTRNPEDEYRWLRDLKPATSPTDPIPLPDFRAGTSIFIYHLQ